MHRSDNSLTNSVIHQSPSVKYTEVAQKVCLHYHRKSGNGQPNMAHYSAIISTVAESLQNAAIKHPDIDTMPSTELEYVAHGLMKQFMDAVAIAERLRNIVNSSTGAQIAIDRAHRRPHDVISNVVNAILPDNALHLGSQRIVHDGQLATEPENNEPDDNS